MSTTIAAGKPASIATAIDRTAVAGPTPTTIGSPGITITDVDTVSVPPRDRLPSRPGRLRTRRPRGPERRRDGSSPRRRPSGPPACSRRSTVRAPGSTSTSGTETGTGDRSLRRLASRLPSPVPRVAYARDGGERAARKKAPGPSPDGTPTVGVGHLGTGSRSVPSRPRPGVHRLLGTTGGVTRLRIVDAGARRVHTGAVRRADRFTLGPVARGLSGSLWRACRERVAAVDADPAVPATADRQCPRRERSRAVLRAGSLTATRS